jgi:hypothetical protein
VNRRNLGPEAGRPWSSPSMDGCRRSVHGRPQGMDGDYRTLSGGHAAEGSIECIFRKIRPYVHGRIAKPWLHRDP